MTKHQGRPVDLDKENAILKVGHDLWFKEGPEKFSIERVAKLANVSKVTIYARFSNKNKLLEKIVSMKCDEMTDSLGLTNIESGDLSEMLIEFGTNLLTFIHSDEHTIFLKASSVSLHKTQIDLTQIYENGPHKTKQKLAQLLELESKKGTYYFPNPAENAELFIGMLFGLNIVRAIYNIDINESSTLLRERVTQRTGQFLKIFE